MASLAGNTQAGNTQAGTRVSTQICRQAASYTLLISEARDGESVLSHLGLQAGDLTYLEVEVSVR